MRRVLVVSPHPDDEALGCGGTLRKHAMDGDRIRTVFLTSGEGGGHGRSPEETRCLREREALSAAEILGVEQTEFWHQADGRLRATGSLVSRLRKLVDQWYPDLIYVTHEHESHPDHRAAARLVKRAIANWSAPQGRPRVLMFEVWTPMRDMDEIVDTTPYIDAKLRAVRAHQSQCEVMGFEPAFRGLGRYRGELHSWPGGEYAEVFVEMRA